MQVVIVGLGQMGFSLAHQLDDEGHDVSGVDPRPDRVELAGARLDVLAVRGSGVSRDALDAAKAQGADLMVAVSGSDEVNIVSCLIGRELGIKRKIARIQSNVLAAEMGDLHDVLGVDDFVTPGRVTVKHLSRVITAPGTTDSAEFAHGRIILRGLRVEGKSVLSSGPLSEVRKRFPEKFLVTAVRRENDIFVPSGDFRVEEGDVVYVSMKAEVFDDFLEAFGLQSPPVRRVVIAGASDIGLDLCAEMADCKYDIVLLEEDRRRCDEAAEALPYASVIHGSPLDRGLMLDLKIEGSLFMGLSRSTEANFAGVVAAKRLGAHHGVMLASTPEEIEIFEQPPVDAVVNPITLSVGAVLRAVRAGKVLFLFKLAGQRAEALEIEAEEGTPGTGCKLAELRSRFPKDAVIAAVETPDGAHVASGDTVVRAGDHVIVVALRKSVPEVVRLFSRKGGGTVQADNGDED